MSGVNECAIEWIRGDAEACVTAYNGSKLKSKIERLAQTHTDEVHFLARNMDGSICALVPVKWIKVSPPRSVSEEQRQAASERLKRYHGSKANAEEENEEQENE